MDGGEDKDVMGSSSTVTVTESVASGGDSEKLPATAATGELREEKTSAETVFVEKSGGVSCNGMEKEVGVSGSGVVRDSGGGGEKLKGKVVLGFDGHEVDLERDAEEEEEEEEEEGGTSTVDDLPMGPVQDGGVEAQSPETKGAEVSSSKEEAREELKSLEKGEGKDAEDSSIEVKANDKALPEGGGDGNSSSEFRTSGRCFPLNKCSIDDEKPVTEASTCGDTEVVRQGSNNGADEDTQGSKDGSKVGDACRVQVSVNGDFQLMDDSGEGDAELNDASGNRVTPAVPGLLNQDTQVVEVPDNHSRGGESQVTNNSKNMETQVSVDGSRDGHAQLDYAFKGVEKAVAHGSVDEDMKVVGDIGDNDIDGLQDSETQENQGPENLEAQSLKESVGSDIGLMDGSRDGDSNIIDHPIGGETQAIRGSLDDTEVVNEPDTHNMDVSKVAETEISNDIAGGGTQVNAGYMDAQGADDSLYVANQVVDGAELVKIAGAFGASRHENVERGLTEEGAPVLIEDLNSHEVIASKEDINDPGVTSGLDGTCGVKNQVSAPTEKAELAEESLGRPMEIVETKEDVAQYSEFKPESTASEDLGQKIQVLEETQVVMVSDDTLEKVPRIEDLEGMLSSAVSHTVPTEKIEIEYPTSETLDKVMQVSVQGNNASVDDGEITCPNIEGMDADAFNENFCFSVEELQASGETVNESTEHHYNAIADRPSFSQPTNVFIGGEVDVTMEDKKTTVADQLVEAGKEVVANGSNHSPDSTSSFQSTQAVAGDDVAQMDHIVGLDASPSRDHQSLCLETAALQNNVLAANTNLTEASGNNLGLAFNGTMMVHPIDIRKRDLHEKLLVGAAKDAEETSVLEDGICQQRGIEEPDHTEEKSPKWTNLHSGGLSNGQAAIYQLPSDLDGEFFVSDLVWGKVRSHPRWPGQIFDPADASEQALKYQKKDSFLVAYFGDRTFAWNEAHLLKPFRSHFSQAVKQSNSEAFQNAVDCALEEVARRVELSLACSCVPNEDRYRIEFQLAGNTGIQEEAIQRGDVDISGSADMFEPANLVNYVKSLAQCPAGGADRLDLVILKSQLFSFYRLKGHSPLPEFQCFGESLEEGEQIAHADSASEEDLQRSSFATSQTQRPYYHKRKHNLKDGIYPGRKDKTLTDLTDDTWDFVKDEVVADGKMVSPSSAKRRKGPNSFVDGSAASEEVKTISVAKFSTATPTAPKPSFKIGECIRRAASQMTGNPSILKSNSPKFEDEYDYSMPQFDEGENNSVASPAGHSSLDELLLQLQSAARDPLQRCSFLNVIVSYFLDFRNSVVVDQNDTVDKRRKVFHPVGDSGTFEFVDMNNDTYWTDRVIENGTEEKPARKIKKRENLFVPVSLDKPVQRPNARKRYSDGNFNMPPPEKPPGYVDEKAPAELVMHFPVVDSVPSEMKLNKMFKCFGPLKESGTEVDRDTNRARVVFRHSCDAEAAYGSASKFNIFGSLLVNYQLNYIISVPFKSEPISITLGDEDANVFLQY